ncbi:magnesium transporter CorA family protein [Desulfurobacterium atlanticum]|uniref:Magnesium transporter n=1 Tax=Desulfurobacterium atlanticum TaxID=240169 RepID=A0A238ZS55_9BACT|nr:magnesium transporter CorA family protein [Desulfurobacterium atlanticum]SNR86170.1 magnesium transporter [Desulfurobacterium atlanticum]
MEKCWVVFKTDEGVKSQTVSIDELAEILEKKPLWIHFRNMREDIEDFLLEKLKINELSIEDVILEDRPKAETFESYVFILLIYFDGRISRKRKFSIFWTKDLIVTIGSRKLFEETKIELSLEEPEDITPDKIFWLISSTVVDRCKKVALTLERQLDDIEVKVFREQNPELLEDISDLSFEIISLRRTVKQLRDVFRSFLSSLPRFGKTQSIHFLRDVADELVMLYDHIDTLHEMLQNIFSVFSSLVEFKLNDIMKTLTIIMTVFAPITMISGYYGMNIVDLPFADSHLGLLIVTGMMALMSFGFLAYFRKKQWL